VNEQYGIICGRMSELIYYDYGSLFERAAVPKVHYCT